MSKLLAQPSESADAPPARCPCVVQIGTAAWGAAGMLIVAEVTPHNPDCTAAAPAVRLLTALPWTGDVGERTRFIERLAAAGEKAPIRLEQVLEAVQLSLAPPRVIGLQAARQQFEREYISSVLRNHEWQVPDAARALGMERANLYRKARQLGIPLRRENGATPRRAGLRARSNDRQAGFRRSGVPYSGNRVS